MEFDISKLPLSFAYSQADVTSFFNNITSKGGVLFLIGPFAINSTGSPLDSVPARTVVFGIGEIDWTTSSSGTTAFTWGADSITENIYLHENSNFYHTVYHTDQFSLARFWTNFPSQGGTVTGTPTIIFDGNITTEGIGYVLATYLRNSNGFAVEAANTTDGTLQSRRLSDNVLRTLNTSVKAGAPVDGDYATPQNGMIVVDSTNNKIWTRIGGTWKGVAVA